MNNKDPASELHFTFAPQARAVEVLVMTTGPSASPLPGVYQNLSVTDPAFAQGLTAAGFRDTGAEALWRDNALRSSAPASGAAARGPGKPSRSLPSPPITPFLSAPHPTFNDLKLGNPHPPLSTRRQVPCLIRKLKSGFPTDFRGHDVVAKADFPSSGSCVRKKTVGESERHPAAIE